MINRFTRLLFVCFSGALFGAVLAQAQDGTGADPVRWVPDRSWLKDQRKAGKPEKGYVPTRASAINIGREFLKARLGEGAVVKAEPLDATLIDGTWIVYGYFVPHQPGYIVKGGTMTIQISKTTGQVKRIDEDQ